MNVIDICESFSAREILNQYYEGNKIFDYKIICMGLNLAIGDIKTNHLTFLKRLYKDDFYDYNESINDLLNNIDNNTKLRIWSSKGNDDDYLLLLYLCNLLKYKTNNISVIFTTDYNSQVLSINALLYKELNLIIKYEKQLTPADIDKYSKEWENLVEVNSNLRVLENGTIKNKQYSDYDSKILDILAKLGQCTIANLVGELMLNFVINDTGTAVYLYLIDRLIHKNKIKVIEKGYRHFNDIIEKYQN